MASVKLNRRQFMILAGIVLALATIIVILIAREPPAPPNYYSVADDSIGLSFNISKNFQAIPKDELSILNPGFAYGYRPTSDARTVCFISTSNLKGGGSITPRQLGNGILKEVRRNHPSAKLSSVAAVNYGQAGGILARLTYATGNTHYTRFEALALGKKRQAIAYCETLSAYTDQYRNNFGTLFTSLKLNQ